MLDFKGLLMRTSKDNQRLTLQAGEKLRLSANPLMVG